MGSFRKQRESADDKIRGEDLRVYKCVIEDCLEEVEVSGTIDFLEDVLEFAENNGYLTQKQADAVDKVQERIESGEG